MFVMLWFDLCTLPALSRRMSSPLSLSHMLGCFQLLAGALLTYFDSYLDLLLSSFFPLIIFIFQASQILGAISFSLDYPRLSSFAEVLLYFSTHSHLPILRSQGGFFFSPLLLLTSVPLLTDRLLASLAVFPFC